MNRPPASGIYQKFYHLAGTSEFLLVDLAVMTVAAPDKFLVREIHDDAVASFDKDGTVRPPPTMPKNSFTASSNDAGASGNGWTCSARSS